MRVIPVLAAIFYFGKPIAPHARPRTTPGPSGKEDIMKRALLVMVIAVLTAPVGTWHPVVAAAPAAAALPTDTPSETSTTTGATSDSSGCALPDGSALAPGSALAAARGCCQRQGGVCGCRDGRPKCCDGTIGAECSCRANTPPSETDGQGGR
jgi:hypothetical protein